MYARRPPVDGQACVTFDGAESSLCEIVCSGVGDTGCPEAQSCTDGIGSSEEYGEWFCYPNPG